MGVPVGEGLPLASLWHGVPVPESVQCLRPACHSLPQVFGVQTPSQGHSELRESYSKESMV